MAHNTVAPDEMTQSAEPGQPAARLLRAEEAGPFVIIESDAAQAWPGLGVKVLRRLVHLRPATLVVEDVVEWQRPAVTRQYWQSRGEWQRDGDVWTACVDGAEVRVDVLLGEGATASAAPYSVDGDLKPVHRLCVETPKARQARIVTLIRARSNAAAPWDSIAVWEAPGKALRLESRDGRRFAVRWEAGTVRLEQ